MNGRAAVMFMITLAIAISVITSVAERKSKVKSPVKRNNIKSF